MKQTTLYRSSRRNAMVSNGSETLETELYRVRRQEQFLAFAALQEQFAYAVAVLSQNVHDVVPEQCDDLDEVLLQVLSVVQSSLVALESPDMVLGTRPYSLLLKLWSFHRMLIETRVQVGGVCGQCRCGRLAVNFTGSYWHLKNSFRAILRNHRELMSLFEVVVVELPQVYVQTNTWTQYSTAAASA